MLAVINMKVGNLRSVLEGFARVGATTRVVESSRDLESAEAIVVPGVGAFGDGIAQLVRHGWADVIRREVLDKHKPILGICLGMQLLADESDEHGSHRGLGLIRGKVLRLQPSTATERVPNMGWCDVTPVSRSSVLLGSASRPRTYYFAHSYAVSCGDAGDVAATLDYGGPTTAVIERGNVFGVQFHPEKSQDAGLDVLDRFVRHVADGGRVRS